MKTAILAVLVLASTSALADTVNLKQVAVDVGGTKFWFPSTLVVKKGDTVKIHAVSKVPGAGNAHGFEIPAFGIKEVIDAKGKDIEFKADKDGVFPINCQLHPAHVGGQLVVMD